MEKEKRQRELFVNTIIIGIGSLFSKLLSFFLVPLYTFLLTPEQYGDFDLLNSYISLVVPVLTLQLEQATLRFSIECVNQGRNYLLTSLKILFLNTLILLLIAPMLKFEYHYAWVLCTIVYSFEIVLSEYLRGINLLKQYTFANMICGVSNLIFTVVFVCILKLGVNGLFYAFTFSYMCAIVYILFVIRVTVKIEYDKAEKGTLKKMIQYSFPLLPNALSWWITNVSDRTIIRIWLGQSYNGMYAVSCKIPTLLSVFYSIFNLAWQQSAMSTAKDDFTQKQKFYIETYKILIRLIYTGSFCVICVSPLFYVFFIDSEYAWGMKLVPILVLASASLNISQYFGGILLGDKDTKTNGLTTLVAAVLNIIVNWLCVEKSGLYAAAVSTFVSYVVLYYLRYKKVKNTLGLKNEMLTYMIYNCIGFIIGALSVWIKSVEGHIFLLVGAVLAFIVVNKKLLESFFKKIRAWGKLV